MKLKVNFVNPLHLLQILGIDLYFIFLLKQLKKYKSVCLALMYTVDDVDYWDNNQGLNYEIIITPPEQRKNKIMRSRLFNNKIYHFKERIIQKSWVEDMILLLL